MSATRGEVSITLEGQDYGLRPSWEAVDAFERGTGTSVFDLARLAAEQRLTLDQAAIITTECLKAWGKNAGHDIASAKVPRIKQLIYAEEGGLMLLMKRLELVLFNAATGGYHPSGEAKAADGKKTPAAA